LSKHQVLLAVGVIQWVFQSQQYGGESDEEEDNIIEVLVANYAATKLPEFVFLPQEKQGVSCQLNVFGLGLLAFEHLHLFQGCDCEELLIAQ
jgi:hypothetical protein